MRASYMVTLMVAASAGLLAPLEVHAATRSPLSALSALPAPLAPRTPEATAAVVGAVVKSKDGYGSTRWHDVNAATGRGYCLSTGENGYRWMSSWGTSAKGTAAELDLDRLVERDGKVTLERTHVHFDPSDATLTAKGRSQVELHEVARTAEGIVVWAFRDGHDVVVLARNVVRGVESRRPNAEEGMFPFISSEGCPFAGARLDARKVSSGTLVQLSVALPAVGTAKNKDASRVIVDASMSRVGRDPEPIIAVSVRTRD